jgi:hypothetical protein
MELFFGLVEVRYGRTDPLVSRTAGEHGVRVLEAGVGAGGSRHCHAHQELRPGSRHVRPVLAQVSTSNTAFPIY